MHLSTPLLTCPPGPAWLDRAARPFHAHMFAMFNSEYGGIVTDPRFMRVPVDDHLVHRGDGVFETLKCVEGRVYCLEEHLDRLFYSADKVQISVPWPRGDLRGLLLDTIRAGGRRDCLVRLLLSRGVGSMGISPYDCPAPGLYILVHTLPPPFMDTHPGGARLVTSALPVKAGIFATIKTCNYLPNAMLKKEAADRGADFAVNFDEQGHLAEGATENIGVVTPEGALIVPGPERILSGTTMNRALALAGAGVAAGWLEAIGQGAINREHLAAAAEVLIFGTTTNVTAVTWLDGRAVGHGSPGPVYQHLSPLLLGELYSENAHTTPAFSGQTHLIS